MPWSADPVKAREYSSRYFQRHKEARMAAQREWVAKNRGSRFGLGPGEYDSLFELQGGLCAVCRQPERSKGKTWLAVDHDHQTEQVRGLLCVRCNTALGMVGDSPDILRELLRYLERHSVRGPLLDN